MLRSFRKPSPAMVVASIALVLALKPVAEAANTVFSTDIVDGEVKNADLGNNQVTRAKIYPNAIDTSRLALLAVTSGTIAARAVTNDKLALNSVGAGIVADNSLTTLDLKGADVQSAISIPASYVASGRCAKATINAAGRRSAISSSSRPRPTFRPASSFTACAWLLSGRPL